VDVHLLSPRDRSVPLRPLGDGYFGGRVDRCPSGTRYRFRLDGEGEFPDPASRRQPKGVFGPSQVLEPVPAHLPRSWGRGRPLEEYVIYELHVGCFSRRGTFQAIVPRLARLRALGITAVELMPVSSFPGRRNWGYDPVLPWSVEESYGGPRALKSLVTELHRQGLAAILDVVFNHFGPEGNFLPRYGPYLRSDARSPWGEAVNLDGPGSASVRRFFRECALRYLDEFTFDALRLDAVHAFVDRSRPSFLEELQRGVEQLGRRRHRRLYLIAEQDSNDPRTLLPRSAGGCGLAAQWDDDFHHALHSWLTGERAGYYQDFGPPGSLARVLQRGYLFTGQYSRFRGRRHGHPPRGLPPRAFVAYAQNHDQVGNRMEGERLVQLVGPRKARIAAGLVVLSPFLPLLFMGEERALRSPFLYFCDPGDAELAERIRTGRKREFRAFHWTGEPPDPTSARTFERSRLAPPGRGVGPMERYYRALLRLRSRWALGRAPWPLRTAPHGAVETQALFLLQGLGAKMSLLIARLGEGPLPLPPWARRRSWRKVLDSESPEWGGEGASAPRSLSLSRSVSPASLSEGLTFWVEETGPS
jgi:maltooligosyltrehalose trehalohydrolase